MALFIEKPLDSSTERLGELLDMVEQRGLVSYVAYNLRHNPIVAQLKADLDGKRVYCANLTDTSYLPDWKPNHKDTYLAHIGACLDLSHNIDLAVHLFSPVESIAGSVDRLSGVTVDADDCVNMVVRHESGVVSNIHINTFTRTRFVVDNPRYIDGHTENEPYRFYENLGHPEHTQQSHRNQLQYFFDNLTNPRMDNCLHDASVLFGQVMAFKARYER
jgi:predicted dehydrogenase